MSPKERLALAREAVRHLPDRGMGLRWKRGSWDYALFEKRFKVGIALEERSIEDGVHGVVVVRDDDSVETLRERLSRALREAGWNDHRDAKPAPYRRSRDRFAIDDED